jgi:hypothetical protein
MTGLFRPPEKKDTPKGIGAYRGKSPNFVAVLGYSNYTAYGMG